ncbi:MAG: heme-binding protein [Pyrinomonadaceae bacterium]
MIATRTTSVMHLLASLVIIAALITTNPAPVEIAHAQAVLKPILISQETSTRAIALESVTQQHEPFAVTSEPGFSTDKRTRITLFVMNLTLAAGETFNAVTGEAEGGDGARYPLTVEYVGPLPEQSWATAITLRLNDNLPEAGDVLVRITYRGVNSNRVRVGIGHIGDGPPDDEGAVPTPGSAIPQSTTAATTLTPADVRTIIAQAVSAAVQLNHPITVIVTDSEGNTIGFFSMTGTPSSMTIRSVGTTGHGLEGTVAPTVFGAISKAGTAAFFSTRGNAFSTRTASFIIQEHFPPGVNFRGAGPLYGVQFSSLPCSDIKRPGLPLGLSGDPGGLPIYKNGVAVGGVGIEGDGLYTVDRDPADFDQPFEEIIAGAAVRGFEAPALIRADNILVDGIRLPYTNVTNPPNPPAIPFGSLPGAGFILFGPGDVPPSSAFVPTMLSGVSGEVDPRFFPFVGSALPAGGNALTSADVQTIISRAAIQANGTRAAIRQPLGSNARVSIAVVDVEGNVLGAFRTSDAPVFGFDVSVQKARNAAFASSANAGALLRAGGFGVYADRAAADGLQLNGSVAFSDRAVGFLHRPFFPDGIDNTPAGPFSTEINEWSPFNVGLQLDLIKTNLLASLGGSAVPCTSIPNLPNGIQIFPGSIPLYKNGVLVGAIGISGDGVDQDDLIAAAGANGFSPPAAIRADQFFVRKVRLPFVKFPRSPNL